MAAKLPSTARERSGKAPKDEAPQVVPVDIGLSDGDGGTDWVHVDLDVDALTFRELDDVRRVQAEMSAPTWRTTTLLATWAMLRRTRPDLSADDVLDLPNRNLVVGDPFTPENDNSPEG